VTEPAAASATVIEPLNARFPFQRSPLEPPDAAHEVALIDDQVSFTPVPTVSVVEPAESVTDGVGAEGCVAVSGS
jgi:hypothetical protein